MNKLISQQCRTVLLQAFTTFRMLENNNKWYYLKKYFCVQKHDYFSWLLLILQCRGNPMQTISKGVFPRENTQHVIQTKPQGRIQSSFGQTDTEENLSKFVPWRYSKNATLPQFVLIFLCKTLSKLLKLSLQKTLFHGWFLKNKKIKQICMALSLWEMRSNLSIKDAASSTEGITKSSVKYLRKRKSKNLQDLLRS